MIVLLQKNYLKIIALVSFGGFLFSGYLSYGELFAKECALGCAGGASLLDVPVCVYGFFMYLTIFALSVMGLKVKK